MPDKSNAEVVAAIKDRRKSRYLQIGLNREHRDWHEKHLIYAEELHDCGECEDEYEEELSRQKTAMLTDIDALLTALSTTQSNLAQQVLNEIANIDPFHRSTSPRVGRGYATGHRNAESFSGEVQKRLRDLFSRLNIEVEE